MRAVSRLGILLSAGAAFALASATALAQEVPATTTTNTPAADSVGPKDLQNFTLNGTVTHAADQPAAAPPATQKRAPQTPTQVARPAIEPSATLTDGAATTPNAVARTTAPRQTETASASKTTQQPTPQPQRQSPPPPPVVSAQPNVDLGSASPTTAPASTSGTFAPAPACRDRWLPNMASRSCLGSSPRSRLLSAARSFSGAIAAARRLRAPADHRSMRLPRRRRVPLRPRSARPSRHQYLHRHLHLRRRLRLRTASQRELFPRGSALGSKWASTRCAASSMTNA